ncbi:hypothetical protein JYT79_00400 [Cardiobacterium sp. AH-315-I02]|nr:hypothetical protein [Cardiobacterium sp. AH-315-I02]
MSDTDTGTLLVDAHVHIYSCFDINKLLDAALYNFARAAKKLSLNHGYTGVLLLAETSRDNWFQRASMLDASGRWQIEKTLDKTVLQARPLTDNAENKSIIYIMAGRQVATAEGLELLALVTDRSFEDGLSLTSALNAVRDQDAIPVLPWAVGKWLGERGQILSSLLKAEAHSDLCLGDNSGRPVFWRNPLHFRQAKTINMRLLPGTDALPFSNETDRVGSFGFMMQGKLSNKQPAIDFKQLLRNKTLPITAYGQLEMPLRFFINQVRLRIS